MDKLNGKIVSKQEVQGKIVNKQSVQGNVVAKQTISGILGIPIMGTTDYNMLQNKPSIENVTLMGNRTMPEFGDRSISNLDIQNIINNVFN